MKKRNKIIGFLATILFILLGLIILRSYLPQNNADELGYSKLWNEFSSEAVHEILILKDNETLRLEKENTYWTANGIDANDSLVNELIDTLLNPPNLEVIASTNARHEAFGFLRNSTNSATLTAGERHQNVLFGLLTSDGRYIRFEGDDTVYLIKGLPGIADSASPNDWINKVLVEIPQEYIERISIAQGTSILALQQNNSEWRMEGDDRILDSGSFSAMISTLSSMVTQGLADDQEMTLNTPEVEVRVKPQGIDEIVLYFSPYMENQYIVTSNTRNGLYLLSQGVVENFKLYPAQLKFKTTAELESN